MSRHDEDLYEWAAETVELIRGGHGSAIDLEAVAEELEELMGNTRRELYRRLRVLLAHLLKWEYQPERHSASWRGTIRIQRDDIAQLLKQSPSLKRLVPEQIAEAYEPARELAADETGLALETFPERCPYSLERVLDPEWWPQ